MSKVSIYEKKWLDLVFEGKNKEYGAYKLRQENEKTSAFAFLSGALLLGGFILILSSFNEKPDATNPKTDGSVVTVKIDEPYTVTPPDEKIEKAEEKVKSVQPEVLEPVIDKGTFVVTKTTQATIDIPTDLTVNSLPTPTNGSATGTLPDTGDGKPSGGNSLDGVKKPTNLTVRTSELDKLPTYPGGMKNFYEFVANNFDRDNLEEGDVVKVNVSFVIERNGSMTDIKVMENVNSAVSKEAIRVLKSLKTKWTPGMKDGDSVRTFFTLPISVVM